jgi:HEPN domain-containing protein
MTPRAERKFKTEYASQLLRIALGDLESAEVLSNGLKGRKENVGYHVAQCIEKSLKAVLVHRGEPAPLTNDLGTLTERVHQLIPSWVYSDLTLFNEYSTFRRYEEGSVILEPEDLAAAIQVGHETLKWATEQCHLKKT